MIDTIQPIGNRVLIVPHKDEQKEGLLIIPDKKEEFYKVISKSDSVETVNVGDIVLVNIYHGNVFRHPEFMIVDDSAIVGIKK